MIRQIGRTTNAIKNLNINGFYIVLNKVSVYHANCIAKSLGRNDIKFVTVLNVVRGYFRGRKVSGYEVDHSVYECGDLEIGFFKELTYLKDNYEQRRF